MYSMICFPVERDIGSRPRHSLQQGFGRQMTFGLFMKVPGISVNGVLALNGISATAS